MSAAEFGGAAARAAIAAAAERSKVPERTVFVKGLKPQHMADDSPVRSVLEVKEYDMGQISNFCQYNDGMLIEYIKAHSAARACQIASLPDPSVSKPVMSTDCTVDEGRAREQERIAHEKEGQLKSLREEVLHERKLREAAQASLGTLQFKISELEKELARARDAAADPMPFWRTVMAGSVRMDQRAFGVGMILDGSAPLRIGNVSAGTQPSCVQSDRPLPLMPCQTPLFYYEVKILDLGKEGIITVGLAPGGFTKRNHHPGWSGRSYAVHGDDGVAYGNPTDDLRLAQKVPGFTAKFRIGDVIGCGLAWTSRSVFFTRNGVLIGAPFHDVPLEGPLATVGSRSPGETFELNFGAAPFAFDVLAYARTL